VFCTIERGILAYRELVSGDKRRARSGKTCPQCGQRFDAKYLSRQIFCGRKCVNALHNARRGLKSGKPLEKAVRRALGPGSGMAPPNERMAGDDDLMAAGENRFQS
jgi:ribosomal protein L37AE/L43A